MQNRRKNHPHHSHQKTHHGLPDFVRTAGHCLRGCAYRKGVPVYPRPNDSVEQIT